LREPTGGLARADCIVITRADQARDINRLKTEIERLSDGRPVLISRAHTRALRPLSQTATTSGAAAATLPPQQQPFAAFCAIGNPDAFFAHIRRDGHELAYTRAFPDHHIYSQADVEALAAEARARGAQLLLTTAKDAVKLRSLQFGLPCYVLEIEIEFDDEGRLLRLISDAVLKRGRPA
jgi:tetraacyldisaccharide 4'-kinase